MPVNETDGIVSMLKEQYPQPTNASIEKVENGWLVTYNFGRYVFTNKKAVVDFLTKRGVL
jgi:hypothetical protein